MSVKLFYISQKAYWHLVANFIDNLYDDDESESGSGWISWFCDLEGHEFFIEVSSIYLLG